MIIEFIILLSFQYAIVHMRLCRPTWWIFQIEDTLVQPQSFVTRLSSEGDSSFPENE